ncbi:MAG: M1 family metallopeptidase, partial [Candidatus Latescibacterota bacterium]
MNRWLFLLAALAALQIAGLSTAKRPKQLPRQDILLLQQELIQQEKKRHQWPASPPRQNSTTQYSPMQAGFDVLHYDIDLDIDPVAEMISGTVAAKCSLVASNVTHLGFNLFSNMTVRDVTASGQPISFVHADDMVAAENNGGYVAGDTVTIVIDYFGTPDSIGRFNPFTFATHGPQDAPTIFSISAPYYAGTWWPCKDVPGDKATANIHITTPDNLVTASNGRLMDVVDLSNGKHRYEWEESYAISTYLISVAVADYVVFSDYYKYGPNDSMEVMYFVYPEDSVKAREDFNVTVSLLELYSSIFGPYPFLQEKYGMAEAKWGGLAMEHQTCTTYGSSLVTGTHQNDRIIAHELAHQWWGDLVTVGDWRDIWLNEGFATYAEALWKENTEGIAAYRDFMNSRDIQSGFKGSIYDPDDLYNLTVYWKGAWVLHMLRHVLGDSVFFQALRDYTEAHAYGNALTEDFQYACESIWGQSLELFFRQWVYGSGRPHYQYSWVQYLLADGHYVSCEVKQVQPEGSP